MSWISQRTECNEGFCKKLFLYYAIDKSTTSVILHVMPTQTEIRRAVRLQLKLAMMELLGGVCVDCGNKYHFSAMDFDHIVPHLKKSTISDLLGTASPREAEDYKILVEEVKKCELRCANCHRVKTWKNKEGPGKFTWAPKKKKE